MWYLPGRRDPSHVWAVLRAFTPAAWAVAALAAFAVLLLIGATTAIIENPVFGRMTGVRPQDYAFLAAGAVLAGLVAGTLALDRRGDHASKAMAGGFLTDLAVGCPVCNKVAVALLGSSGALTYFGPLQFFIGVASLALLAMAFVLRARSLAGTCPVR